MIMSLIASMKPAFTFLAVWKRGKDRSLTAERIGLLGGIRRR